MPVSVWMALSSWYAWGKTTVVVYGRLAVAFLSHHTGLPAIVVAGLLLAIGYRVLKKTARFAIEVVVLTAVLAAASELGMLRW